MWAVWTYLQVSDDRGVIIDGLAVDCLAHALAVEGELLHSLLLSEVGPLVEHLPRRLVLEVSFLNLVFLS